jgi:superfamily II DNA or RNA helicase
VRLVLTEAEAAVHDVIGTSAFLRARDHVEQGELFDLEWEPKTGLAHGRVRGETSGVAVATVTTNTSGAVVAIDGSCSCARSGCAHPAALVLAGAPVSGAVRTATPVASDAKPRARARTASGRAVPQPRPAAWETALAKLVDSVSAAAGSGARAGVESEQPGLGLQFDLVQTPERPRVPPSWRIALRPVMPGRTGWVRTGVSWSTLSYHRIGRSATAERHWRLLQEILAVSTTGASRQYYGYHDPILYLDQFSSRRIWDLLAEADEAGLPIVQTAKQAGPVRVSRSPARMSVQAGRDGEELVLVPALLVDGAPIGAANTVLVGAPPHGVVWWGVRGEPPARGEALRLAPLAGPLAPAMEKALAGPPIRIPAGDEDRFFQHFYPGLLRQVEVVADEDSVRLPEQGPATLTLTVNRLPGHRLALRWQWIRPVGAYRYEEPLWAPSVDETARGAIVRRVTDLIADLAPALLDGPDVTVGTAVGAAGSASGAPGEAAPRLAATAILAGDAVIGFLTELAPRLAGIDGVDVVAGDGGAGPEYRESLEPPVISFAGVESVGAGHVDWFDLAVVVSVEGESVVFDELFVALAEERQYFILPSGAYISLDRPEFAQLRELIAESRALEDAPPGVLRVGRFQTSVWEELAELGEITGQAAAWQRTVATFARVGFTDEHPVPRGLHADLRPYQRDGYGWLAARFEHGLGGILADDMGLGKTVQALALICRAREAAGPGAGGPFLVVAPASVVHNWVAEASRFAPDLEVRAVSQTETRRGMELAEVASGADMVVTSYTLFRLEFDDYQELDWSGLVLDEAQFVKNPAGQGYRCAKRLSTPFKLAITGTPLENNLAELWALCAITAPGLFPRLDRFTEYYRNPIEKGRDSERLAQLRRRVRPLMLRRKKADVDVDLPDKQEQVIELALEPRHRKVYQTYLQRERQKVLGLLGNLEKHRFEIFRSLTLLRQASLDISLVDPKHRTVPSTKLDALVERVADLVAEGHRTLVFSQFTRFLDRARQRLEQAGIACCYLDGKTTNRAVVLDEFKTGTAPVFLISLKAGGFGLNLTEADYCILLDPWWNPATEAQAVDRIHRMGQTRHVMVYRLVAKDTIEEKVMALKARKAELFSSVLDGGEFSSVRLTASDIQALLE